MVDWPSELPEYPEIGSLSETRSGSYRNFIPDVGRPLVSASNSKSYQMWTGTYLISDGLDMVFWNFWDSVLSKGVGTFNITHPRTGLKALVEFSDATTPPVMEKRNKGLWAVNLTFRVIQ